jgi:hypothetical protein
MVIENADYAKFYRTGDPIPRKTRLDSIYGLCFRECLGHLLLHILKMKRQGKGRHALHLVIEKGHKNLGDVLRIIEEERQALQGKVLLGDVTLTEKERCPPLMAADFLAHSHYTSEVKERAGIPVRQWDPKRDGKAQLTVLHYKPGSLANLRRETGERFMASSPAA